VNNDFSWLISVYWSGRDFFKIYEESTAVEVVTSM
jgi:hypothetical protein